MAADIIDQSLFNNIQDAERETISDSIVERLQTSWNEKCRELSNVQSEKRKDDQDYEQQKFILEKEILGLKSKLNEEGTARCKAESLQQKAEATSKTLENDLHIANERVNTLLRELEALRTDKEDTSARNVSLAALVESKAALVKDLEANVNSLEGHLQKALEEKCGAFIQAQEANTHKLKLEYKEKQHEEEKNLFTRHVELLKGQLEEGMEEIRNMRHNHSSSLLSIQGELDHSLMEGRFLAEERDALQKSDEERRLKIKSLLESLNQAREAEDKLEETFGHELSAQERLASIYKISSEDRQKRCDGLEKGIEELRQLLQEASEQFGALERAKQKSEEEARIALDEKTLLIEDLRDELQKVNVILEARTPKDDYLGQMYPSAAAAKNLVNKGLTLSQLYNEYMSVSEKYLKMEQEKNRLERYIDQILKEFEEKAPSLKRQKDDYQEAIETISFLREEVQQYKEELDKQRDSSEQARRHSNYIGRENDRLNLQIQDLGKQVTILLNQVEAARAGLAPPPAEVFETLSHSSSANELISQHLVPFRNVRELQEQNQKLLVSIRDMADKLDSAEKSAVEEKTKELNKKLEYSHKRLSELSDERTKMQVMVEQLKSSRDAYKAVADQKSPISTMPHLSTPNMNRHTDQLQKELTDVKREMAKLDKSHEEYRIERDKNYQMEMEEYKKMKSSFEKTKKDNVRLLSLAEYNDERLKVLQSNCDSYQRQLKVLEERNGSWQEIIARHETSIESLRHELKEIIKKLTREEIAAGNLREEKAILKEAEARLRAERDSLQHYQTSQSKIMINLDAIKNNLERKDSEDTMRRQNQVADLSDQCSRLKAKIESNTDVTEAKIKMEALDQQLKNSIDEREKATNELLEAQQQLISVRGQLKESQEKLRVSSNVSPSFNRPGVRPQRSPSPISTQIRPSGPMNTSLRELQVQLSEERSKLVSLQASLEQADNNICNLKKLSEQQSSQLQEAVEVDKKLKEEISQHKKELEEREKIISELKENLQTAQQSERAVKVASDHQLMKLTEDLEERENEIEEVQKNLDEAKKAEVKALAAMRESSRLASETQDKYEREVMLHGADLQALTALKERLSLLSTQIESNKISKIKADEELSELRIKLDEKEAIFTKTSQDLTERVKELEGQNQSLLDQFTKLSDKMSGLEAKLISSSADSGNTSFTEDDARSADQLREVIKYLRRERELASTVAQVAQTEASRLQAQKKSLESQVDLLNKYLAEEKQKNQGQNENTARYNELLRRVQTMDALTDSNRLLREEKESLKTSLEENRAKVSSLQSQIEPLQEKIRETTDRMESLAVDKKGLQEEKELYKKRTQELVEKLNKARPEDLIKLQQELNATKKIAEEKQAELIRTKTMVTKVQKSLQESIQHKFKLEQKIEDTREQLEQRHLLQQDYDRLKNQLAQSMDKGRTLETNITQMQSFHQKEIQKVQEHNNQLLKEIIEFRQKEEETRQKIEALKSELKGRERKFKELESLFVSTQKSNENLEKQALQLRKIATKYKKKAESIPTTSEGGVQSEESTSEPVKDDDKREEESQDASQDIIKKTELEKLKNEKEEEVSKLQADLQKINGLYTQLKDTVTKQISDTAKKLDESLRKQSAYESQIMAHKKEREQQTQHFEGLQKKLLMQQRQIENLQKQTSIVSKGVSSGISIEKVTDTPPTANIKPMAAPVAPVASRSQVTAQSGPGASRSIPTASIRPMAPSQAGQSTSIVVVPPMEAHSAGDGAVSSTVTLPQATVTPTPAVPTSTSTQPFSFALTATVSPTPLSTSIANSGEMSQQPPQSSSIGPTVQPSALSVHSSTSNVAAVAPASISQVCMPVPPLQGQQESNVITATSSADSIISQAIAMVAPHGDLMADEPHVSEPQSSGSTSSRKRKLEEIDEDESKRSCVELLESSREEALEEDAGEPSSSSSQVGDKRPAEDDDDEILIVPSDDEAAPSSQEREARMDDEEENCSQGLIIMDVQGGREAEMQMSSLESEAQQSHTREAEEQDAPEAHEQVALLSSFQPPTRPGRGSMTLTQEQPTSSRQSVMPFPQLSQFEETDDRLVPSTPTLIVPRQGDFATGEGVSSPQVPSQDFIFRVSSEAVAPSHVDSAQITEGGTIDVTRMDLAQLDDGTHKSAPTTPVRSSPAGKKIEISSEGNISSSAGEGSSAEVESSPVKSFLEAGSFSEGGRSKHEEPDSGIEETPAEPDGKDEQDECSEHGSSLRSAIPEGESILQIAAAAAQIAEDEEDSTDPELLGIPEGSSSQAQLTGAALARTTRSSVAAQPSGPREAAQLPLRRITPIVYERDRPQRDATFARGMRGMEGSQGRGLDSQSAPRYPGPRGSVARRSTARRSRAHRGSYGHM